MRTKCKCVKTHQPDSFEDNYHHIVPKSWGGLSVPDNMIWLCPTTHANVHSLLNRYVHLGGPPAWDELKHHNFVTRALAKRAWDSRPNDKPPFTIV